VSNISGRDEYMGVFCSAVNRDPIHLLQTEHRNPEGRTYWFNTATKESVWEKPDGEIGLDLSDAFLLNNFA
jgi:hypothetical protein